MVRNGAFLVETTLMARIDCKRLSSVTEIVEEEAVEVDYLEVRQGTYITFASIMHVKG
jgi:hypothetical protein